MSDFVLKTVVVGSYETNCYLLIDKETGAAALIDPGFYTPELEAVIRSNGVEELEYILLTHGHLDHTCGTARIKEKFGGKVVIGEADAVCLAEYKFSDDTPDYKQAFTVVEADILIGEEAVLPFGNKKITVIHTPGHTLGEVCYIIDNLFFAGDVLFRGAIGRSDLEGGNIFTLIRTLKMICSFDKDYLVLTGHGPSTTLAYEKRNNRFLTNIVKNQERQMP